MRIDRIKLIAEMARQDISVSDMVAMTGRSRATIANIRSGKSCSKETAEAIAKALGLTVDKLKED